MTRHFLTLDDVTVSELETILSLSAEIKAEYKAGWRTPTLAGRTLALIFDKPSLRTRVSFEAGMGHLGGHTLFLGQEVGYGKRESEADFGAVLSTLVDVIAFRAKQHSQVVSLAKHCTCPVINALTDEAHPCQALADVLTIQENFGSLQGRKVAWVGDSNNVTVSLLRAAAKLGFHLAIASPKEFQFDSKTVSTLVGTAPTNGFDITITEEPAAALKNAAAVYTDVWVSMGQESEELHRKQVFAPYQVNTSMMKMAMADAIFLHCLPAKRGQEVTDEVMDSPQSRIVQQAENRLHTQKGLLVWLLLHDGTSKK